MPYISIAVMELKDGTETLRVRVQRGKDIKYSPDFEEIEQMVAYLLDCGYKQELIDILLDKGEVRT